MASSALKDAVLTFLEGDSGDVRTTINAEQASLMAAGSCYGARGPRGPAARKAHAPAASVEIAYAGRREEEIGIGWAIVALDFDLHCILRRKDRSEGKSQQDVLEDMARALLRRYSGASNLSITAAGATFVRSEASVVEVDSDPELGELARSVVRVTFSFTEALAANT